jgi:cytidine deaminase
VTGIGAADPTPDPVARTHGHRASCRMPSSIPWKSLRAHALEAAQHAYAPYSRFKVGAAGFTDDGHIVTGCNVENASYGLTLCAECGVVSALHGRGGGQLTALVVVTADGVPCTPCGRCRQLLLEHGGPECLVHGPDGPRRVVELLPDAFGPEQMESRAGEPRHPGDGHPGGRP